MKVIIRNFGREVQEKSFNDVKIICFCGCDWHGCDCEYNCSNDDDCTQDTDR